MIHTELLTAVRALQEATEKNLPAASHVAAKEINSLIEQVKKVEEELETLKNPKDKCAEPSNS
jgi:uncharacterized protein (UPF0335 family)